MATGVTKWSSKGKTVQRMSFKPFPAGEYTLVLRTEKAEVAKSKENPNAVPYVKCRAEVPEVQTESGKPRLVFLNFHCSLKPGSDDIVMPERGNGILSLANALGEDVEFDVRTSDSATDAAGNPITYLSPKAVQQWLKSKEGTEVRASIKVKPASGAYSAGNEVEFFLAADTGDAESDEEETEEADDAEDEAAGKTDDDESEAEADEVDEDEEADEEEEAPPPAKKKAAAPAKKKSKK